MSDYFTKSLLNHSRKEGLPPMFPVFRDVFQRVKPITKRRIISVKRWGFTWRSPKRETAKLLRITSISLRCVSAYEWRYSFVVPKRGDGGP